MTDVEERALAILARRGPLTASQLGLELWAPERVSPSRAAAWSRPAGRLLKRLRKTGKVVSYWDGSHTLHRLLASRRDSKLEAAGSTPAESSAQQ